MQSATDAFQRVASQSTADVVAEKRDHLSDSERSKLSQNQATQLSLTAAQSAAHTK
jgi:hypothetical protein